MASNIFKFFQSPQKPASSRRTSRTSRTSLNSAASGSRGVKRKGKTDPYDDMGADEDYKNDDNNDNNGDSKDDGGDDDEVIPARKTPASQRSARSRRLSAMPRSSTGSRASPAGKRPHGRPSLKSQLDIVQDATSFQPNRRTRAEDPNPASAKPDPLVPEAPMGGLDLLSNNDASPSTPSVPSARKSRAEASTRPTPHDNIIAEQPRAEPTAPPGLTEQAADDDNREVHEIRKLLKYRMASEPSGAVELLVQWEGEGEEDATWELEAEIQQGAEEVLYEFWKAQGGRINALFHKPKNPPPEVYHVFNVLRHEKHNRGGFRFEVQWVGHPSTRGETSMETETKLKSIAPELLDQYWKSVGGRDSHLAKRGRAKKS